MKSTTFWLLLGALYTPGLLGETALHEGDSTAQRPSAVVQEVNNRLDEFRPSGKDALMPRGADAGKPIDVDWRRSGQALTPEEARRYFPDFDPHKEVAIANVKHFDRWYVARIPLEDLAEVKLHRYRILEPVPVNHAGVRFVMKPGKKIRLVPQERGAPYPPLEYESLGFGIYALGAKGRTFGVANSAQGRLVSAYQFFTPDEMLERYRTDAVNGDMKEISLDEVSPEATRSFFKHVAEEATRKKYSETYGMFRNNCVHRLLALFSRSQPAGSSVAKAAKARKRLEFNVSPRYGAFRQMTDSTDWFPTGLVNGFSPVIKTELYRRGALSPRALVGRWEELKEDPELGRLLAR